MVGLAMKKTIGQQLGIIDFPFEVFDKTGNQIYREGDDGEGFDVEIFSNNTSQQF